ncbi:endolytic transglycosylase MltG [Croceimicrobium sp.]|uniref:endolytic transglycosylase MltG n=1 Tax=Croceimicrobium sp. TaxID=2828340 RepID=UPI003BAD9750
MKRGLLILLGIIILIGGYLGYRAHRIIWAPNVVNLEQSHHLYIEPGTSYEELLLQLDTLLIHREYFELLAEWKKLPQNIKPGKYAISSGMSNNSLVNRLRAGIQEPVRLTLNMAYTLEDLAGQAGEALEPDSLDFLQYLRSDQVLEDFKIKREELPGFFLSNTYEFYWITSPHDFVQRMLRESERFWQSRTALLEKSGLSRHEVITLASIVESETARPDEMPMVAGLYLNRLEKGIKLQSDPTVIYAMKLKDPDLIVQRVYTKNLDIDSPYNTYLHMGLPPGPIRIPDPRSIDAVLKAKDHSYIFMCADPDRPGYHSFAQSLRQHNINKAKYHRWANRNGIR